LYIRATGEQQAALAHAVHAYAAHIDNLPVLAKTVEHICNKHASLHIQPEQYAIVGTYLLSTIEQLLNPGEAVLNAWETAYWQLANMMIIREAQLYSLDSFNNWKKFKCVRKVKESDDITSFYWAPIEKDEVEVNGDQNGDKMTTRRPLPSYIPGQYISLRIYIPGLGYSQTRQYSLSDSPKDGTYYRISVKREAGDVIEKLLKDDPVKAKAHPGWVSNVLHEAVNVGTVVDISHPRGVFHIDTSSMSKVVLISAGVGITPLMAILNSLTEDTKSKRRISWIHGTRNSKTHAFKQHVEEIAARCDNVQTRIFSKDPLDGQIAGRINLDTLDKEEDLFLQDEMAEYYVCGPLLFMNDMVNKLMDLGVSESRVHYEVYGTGALGQNNNK